MKKKLFFVVLVVLVLTGCGIKKSKSVSELKIETSLNSSKGDINNIELDKEDIISYERIFKPDKCEDEADCGGTEIYKIKGLKEGKVTLLLIKKNSSNDSVEKIKYTITVDKDLKLTEKHKKVK